MCKSTGRESAFTAVRSSIAVACALKSSSKIRISTLFNTHMFHMKIDSVYSFNFNVCNKNMAIIMVIIVIMEQ